MTVLYIIGGFILGFILLQYLMMFRMKMKKGKPAPELTGKFEKAVKSGDKALFYFYSPGCGACRPMTPVIERMMKKNKNVFKVNIANEMDTARKFGVMGTPSTVLIRDGKIAEFIVGPKPGEQVEGLLR